MSNANKRRPEMISLRKIHNSGMRANAAAIGNNGCTKNNTAPKMAKAPKFQTLTRPVTYATALAANHDAQKVANGHATIPAV